MRRYLYMLLCAVLCTVPVLSRAQDSVAVPKGFTQLAKETGDLDKDGQNELVIVYNTPQQTDFGTERLLRVFKKDGNSWKIWQESHTAVLSSDHGGMMGDPFDGLSIQLGCIVIDHFGGSRQKWHYTHRYRFQNGAFCLIGATVNFGAPCDYFTDFDYNLSTGQVIIRTTTEECDEAGEATKSKEKKTTATRKPTKPLLMKDFEPGENQIKLPGAETLYY